jgi:hypothetical protein
MSARRIVTRGTGIFVFTAAAACGAVADSQSAEQSVEPVATTRQADSNNLNLLSFPNTTGISTTYSDNPHILLKPQQVTFQPFFTSFGTNGRACIHCHTPGDNWGINPTDLQFRFNHPLDTTNGSCLVDITQCPLDPDPTHWGSDPVFRLVDGAVSPNADVSTTGARRTAYAMLLTKGLIRVGIGIPANAQFTLAAVDDPYGYASAAQLSLFRRPLPATNLRLSPAPGKNPPPPTPVLTTVMWDGRETLPGHDIIADLFDQANGATLGHAQAIAGLSTTDLQGIVDFETGLHTAQEIDQNAGDLTVGGANGGPVWLAANQPFYYGINDVLTGDSVTGAPFTPNVFTIFTRWASLPGVAQVPSPTTDAQAQSSPTAAQAQIARGEALFDTKPIAITGVGGLNDALGVATIPGTCTTCHDSPNYGHHSVRLPINIGTADASRRTADMPLYTLQNIVTGATVQTTDPGRALITGKWADIGKFKGPILRGLAGRAPYFHNGSAATVADAINFYDTRFGIGFTAQEKADLAAFLLAL